MWCSFLLTSCSFPRRHPWLSLALWSSVTYSLDCLMIALGSSCQQHSQLWICAREGKSRSREETLLNVAALLQARAPKATTFLKVTMDVGGGASIEEDLLLASWWLLEAKHDRIST